MSFPRDAILGTGFATFGRASPLAPDARPIYNKRESPIRTVGDWLRIQLPHLWPQIQANCARSSSFCVRLTDLKSNWPLHSAREMLCYLFDWEFSPEGYSFWLREATHDS